jgi:pilus assembly protein FimV
MKRRTALSLLGGSVAVALSGCLGGGGGGDNGDDGDNGGSEAVITNSFRAESREGGLVWFGSPNEEDFRESDLNLPPSEDIPDPVELEAEVNNDGTWESTSLNFPPIDVVPGIQPTVEAPNGFSGEYDEQEGLWTVEGRIRAAVENDEGEELTLEFPLNATTGESGALEGSFEVQDGTVVATIVDNESVVDDTFGNEFVDNELNLPGEFEGDNWFELTLELEPM